VAPPPAPTVSPGLAQGALSGFSGVNSPFRYRAQWPSVECTPEDEGLMNKNNEDNDVHVEVTREHSREPLGHRVERTREHLTDVVDDKVRAARRALRKSRHTAEDLADEVRLEARRNPLQTLGIALGIGAFAGLLMGLVARGPRRGMRSEGRTR